MTKSSSCHSRSNRTCIGSQPSYDHSRDRRSQDTSIESFLNIGSRSAGSDLGCTSIGSQFGFERGLNIIEIVSELLDLTIESSQGNDGSQVIPYFLDDDISIAKQLADLKITRSGIWCNHGIILIRIREYQT